MLAGARVGFPKVSKSAVYIFMIFITHYLLTIKNGYLLRKLVIFIFKWDIFSGSNTFNCQKKKKFG